MRSKKFRKSVAVMLCMAMLANSHLPTLVSGAAEDAAAPEAEEVLMEEVSADASSDEEQQNMEVEEPSGEGLSEGEISGGDLSEGESLEGESSEEELSEGELSGEAQSEDASAGTGEVITVNGTDEESDGVQQQSIVYNEALELQHDFVNENNEIVTSIKAYIPAGSFEADASQIAMEVTIPSAEDSEHIDALIKNSLTEGTEKGELALYQIRFLVDGAEATPLNAVTVTCEGTNIQTATTINTVVFCYQPPKDEQTPDVLTEIPSSQEILEHLQAAGEDASLLDLYDTSDIVTDGEGMAKTIQLKLRQSGIFGCYTVLEKTEQTAEGQTTEGQTAEVPEEAVEVAVEQPFKDSYDDGTVNIHVSAEAGVLPENVQMKVTPLEKTKIPEDADATTKHELAEINAQYDATKDTLEANAQAEEKELGGFLAYDISFWVPDENGTLTETEPTGNVDVQMTFAEGAKPQMEDTEKEGEEISVIHLKENGSEVIPETVSNAVVNTAEDSSVKTAVFTADSFSVFTITWTHNGTLTSQGDGKVPQGSFNLNVTLVDENGNNLVDQNGDDVSKGVPISVSTTGDYSQMGPKELAIKVLEDANLKGYDYVRAYFDTRQLSEKTITNIALWQQKKFDKNKHSSFELTFGDGTKHQITLNENSKAALTFVVKKVGPIPTTLPTVSEDINISLFNYDKTINNNKFADGCKGFWFYSGTNNKDGSQSGTDSVWTNAGSQGVKQGIVKNNLDKDGYPELINNKGSLKGIFGGASSATGVTESHTGLSGLFRQDEEGYYYYNSTDNAAVLNKDKNEIEIYNAKLSSDGFNYGNFLPFNKMPVYAVAGKLNKIPAKSTDMWFGMHINFNFVQPKDGKINGKNMRFEFSGDDDVWVFIDGKLVLDIGGIHAEKKGHIDFATGEVVVENNRTNIWQCFKNAGVSNSGQFTEENAEGIFKDYSQHRLDFFYLERGGGAANCKLKFNIFPIPKDALNVQKIIDGYDGNVNTDEQFTFKVEMEDDNGDFQAGAYKYDLYDENNKLISKDNVTDASGCFRLRHTQRAVFRELDINTRYLVQEINVPDKYETVMMSKNQESGSTTEVDCEVISENEQDGTFTVQSEISTISDVNYLVVHNRADDQKLSKLKLTKVMAGVSDESFAFQVKVNGVPYSGKYYVEDNDTEKFTAVNGSVTLNANQTVILEGNLTVDWENGIPVTGFLPGSSFEVTEVGGAGYKAEYQVKDADNPQVEPATDSTNGKAAGNLKENQDAEVTVTNYAGSITVVKQVDNQNAEDADDRFMISLKSTDASQIVYSMALVKDESKTISLDKDRTLSITEIVPQEYNKTNTPQIEIQQKINGRWQTVKASLENSGKYHFEKLQEYKIIVKNYFEHKDYFHHSASADNAFITSHKEN